MTGAVTRRSTGLPARRAEPWERQNDESEKAWEAFRTYRELQPPRKIDTVSKALNKAPALCYRWASRHRWQERIVAWENEQDRELRALMGSERREVIRRHIRVARLAQVKALERLSTIDPSTLSPGDLIRLLEYASKAERELYGLTDPEDGPQVAPVQIVIDPRLLPAGFRTVDVEDVTDRRLVIDAAPEA